jgi:hypothetical protein
VPAPFEGLINRISERFAQALAAKRLERSTETLRIAAWRTYDQSGAQVAESGRQIGDRPCDSRILLNDLRIDQLVDDQLRHGSPNQLAECVVRTPVDPRPEPRDAGVVGQPQKIFGILREESDQCEGAAAAL